MHTEALGKNYVTDGGTDVIKTHGHSDMHSAPPNGGASTIEQASLWTTLHYKKCIQY